MKFVILASSESTWILIAVLYKLLINGDFYLYDLRFVELSPDQHDEIKNQLIENQVGANFSFYFTRWKNALTVNTEPF